MIEPELIDPEPVPATPRERHQRRALLAGVIVLAVVAGGIAVAAGGGRAKPAPLALMAGNGAPTGGETMAASAGGSAASPAIAPAADGRAFAPNPVGGWGLEFKVAGPLPELPDHAAAWKVSGPALDGSAVARIAGALGVSGTPVSRDRGWFVDDGDRTLAATPAGDTWSVSYYRSRYDATDTGPAATGPGLSPADAERRVQDLIDRMGAPAQHWQVVTTETQIGPGWACAAPTEELTKLEADKLRLESGAASSASTPAGSGGVGSAATGSATDGSGAAVAAPGTVEPAPDQPVSNGPGATPACPPPPAPVKGFNVALFPVLDGHRAEWALWNVTLRADGRVENLYGAWATFERAGDYKLRSVDAALKELTSGPRPLGTAAGAGAGGVAVATPGVAVPAIARAPVCSPVPMPMPAEKTTTGMDAPSASTPAAPSAPALVDAPAKPSTVSAAPEPVVAPVCSPPVPQVVMITGVELGLIQAPVFESGRVHLDLVPGYRFLGHFENGSAWENSVIALHPDAIAPPPDVPVAGDGRESGGTGSIGKAVPPTPPRAEAH